MALPSFTSEGILPVGDYRLTIEDLRSSHLVTGEGSGSRRWDATWRAHLVNNLAILVGQLRKVGIQNIFIDGSFVERKDHPNDIDGYFECPAHRFVTGEIETALNALDRYHVWTWDEHRRTPDRNSTKQQLPMWHRYRVELYPHYPGFIALRDKFGNELEFPAAFRVTRDTNLPKGIVQLIE